SLSASIADASGPRFHRPTWDGCSASPGLAATSAALPRTNWRGVRTLPCRPCPNSRKPRRESCAGSTSTATRVTRLPRPSGRAISTSGHICQWRADCPKRGRDTERASSPSPWSLIGARGPQNERSHHDERLPAHERGAGGDVARHQVAEARVAALQVVIALGL